MTDSPNRTHSRPFFNWKIGLLAAFLPLILIAAAWLLFSRPRTEFPLEEIPAPPPALDYAAGPFAGCLTTPFQDVKVYPKFVSSEPLFGRIALGPNASDGKNRAVYDFALDESEGTGKGHDRLYFDLNRNLDLTDDKVLAATEPAAARAGVDSVGIFFEHITVPWDFGGDIGVRAVELVPSYRRDATYGNRLLKFDYASVRSGAIRIAGRRYEATLSRYGLTGRYDSPNTRVKLECPPGVLLFPGRGKLFMSVPYRWKACQLGTFLNINRSWYRLAATPLGDRLKVMRYKGDLGVFEVAVGPASDAVAVADICSTDTRVKITSPDRWTEFKPWAVHSLELPVGDYCLSSMNVKSGNYYLGIAQTQEPRGVPRDPSGHAPRYFIKIRKDRPFKFSLERKLSVSLPTPRDGDRLKPGDNLKVCAFLVDAEDDIALYSIQDIRLAGARARAPAGELNADVTVTDSTGKVLAQGKFPFSALAASVYIWQVPDDIRLSGPQEKFTVTVTYDTGPLSGKIESSRYVIIENPEAR